MNSPYRTAAIVDELPCGSCVRDLDHPEERRRGLLMFNDGGYPYWVCPACHEQWCDEEDLNKAKASHAQITDTIRKMNEDVHASLYRENEETRRMMKRLYFAVTVIVIATVVIKHLFLP